MSLYRLIGVNSIASISCQFGARQRSQRDFGGKLGVVVTGPGH